MVQHHLNQLLDKRYIKQSANDPNVFLTYDTPQIPLVYLKNYGRAQCGPDGDILTGAVEDTIPIPSEILRGNPDDAFLVTASGDSMSPDIQDGDMVIGSKAETVETGQIVIGSLNGEAFIKRFRKIDSGEIILESLNGVYDSLLVRPGQDELRIAGRYIGLIRV